MPPGVIVTTRNTGRAAEALPDVLDKRTWGSGADGLGSTFTPSPLATFTDSGNYARTSNGHFWRVIPIGASSYSQDWFFPTGQTYAELWTRMAIRHATPFSDDNFKLMRVRCNAPGVGSLRDAGGFFWNPCNTPSGGAASLTLNFNATSLATTGFGNNMVGLGIYWAGENTRSVTFGDVTHFTNIGTNWLEVVCHQRLDVANSNYDVRFWARLGTVGSPVVPIVQVSGGAGTRQGNNYFGDPIEGTYAQGAPFWIEQPSGSPSILRWQIQPSSLGWRFEGLDTFPTMNPSNTQSTNAYLGPLQFSTQPLALPIPFSYQ